MKNHREFSSLFGKEVCRAICAIAHVNIFESENFIQSISKKIKIRSYRKRCFSDRGVSVEIDNGKIGLELKVKMKSGSALIFHDALKLQSKIFDEVFHLTGLKIKKIDVMIVGIYTS